MLGVERAVLIELHYCVYDEMAHYASRYVSNRIEISTVASCSEKILLRCLFALFMFVSWFRIYFNFFLALCKENHFKGREMFTRIIWILEFRSFDYLCKWILRCWLWDKKSRNGSLSNVQVTKIFVLLHPGNLELLRVLKLFIYEAFCKHFGSRCSPPSDVVLSTFSIFIGREIWPMTTMLSGMCVCAT